MTKVRLSGLSIYSRRGKWYVYHRPNGKALVRGFEGSRADLEKHIAEPAFLKLYSEIKSEPKTKGFGTLGGLFSFYKTKDRWTKLAPRTKADYQAVMDWLKEKGQLGTPVIAITPADMARTRDKAASDRYVKFSSDALACLSAAFSIGREYGYAGLKENPVKGISRIKTKASKSANRRWTEAEWDQVWQIVPKHLRPALGLARRAGLRGQDIAVFRWDNITKDADESQYLTYTSLKNDEEVTQLIEADLASILDAEEKTTLTVCKNSKGRPYPSENAMRKAWQDFKASPIFEKSVPTGADLTLHGLRVTFASELKEKGFSNAEIAKMLGDKTERMGGHYSRGADDKVFAKRVSKKRQGG